MRGLLLLSLSLPLGCSPITHPVRASSLGAPTTVTEGERELIAGGGALGTSTSLNPNQSEAIEPTGLLAGTWRAGLSDRVAVDIGAEMVLAGAWGAAVLAASSGLRYTTAPRLRQRRALWGDLEVGLGANVLALSTGPAAPGVGAYAGAGVAGRLGDVTTFARYRFQMADGVDQVTGDYHSVHLGVQGPLVEGVDLYAATGLATAGAREDDEGGPYRVYGPFPLHIDIGMRVRLRDRAVERHRPRRCAPCEDR